MRETTYESEAAWKQHKEPRGVQNAGEDSEDEDESKAEMFWTTYAIMYWMQERFKQNPMTIWTTDNYDGHEIYKKKWVLSWQRNISRKRSWNQHTLIK